MKTIHLFLIAICISLFLSTGACADVSTDKLASDLYKVLKKHYPSDKVKKWSGYMAIRAAGGANNYDHLRTNLIKVFDTEATPDPNLAWLRWKDKQNSLQNMASEIAFMEFPDKVASAAALDSAADALGVVANSLNSSDVAAQSAPSAPSPRSSVKAPFDVSNGTAAAIPPNLPPAPEAVPAQGATPAPPAPALSAKAEMLQNLQTAKDSLTTASAEIQAQALAGSIGNQPVTGDASTNNVYGQISLWTGAKLSNPYTISSNRLSSGGTSTDGYIEINLSSRYVLRQGDDASDIVWNEAFKTKEDGYMHFVCPLFHMPDIDTRFGYLFRGTTAPTNYTASTIAGTADFYSETSIGLPILRYCSDDNYWKQQVSIEIGGGFSTDKNHLDLHPDFFAGLGWQGSYFINSTNQGYWLGRVGYAMLDQPLLTGDTNNTVQLNSIQQPKFAWKGAPSIGVIVTYPLSSSISLQAGANAYFTQNPPTSWNATVGATLDLSKFFSSILK